MVDRAAGNGYLILPRPGDQFSRRVVLPSYPHLRVKLVSWEWIDNLMQQKLIENKERQSRPEDYPLGIRSMKFLTPTNYREGAISIVQYVL